MTPLHYMERLARDLEDEWLKGLLDEYKRDLAGREPKADRRTASPKTSTTAKRPVLSRGPVQPEAVSRPAKPLECHAGKRAPRYVESMAELAAHPEVYRCPECNMLLNPPEYQPAPAARPARKDSKGQKKEKV